MIGDNCCVFVISKESELHHSIQSFIDGAHPGPKTDRDYLGRYCPKTFETTKGNNPSLCLCVVSSLATGDFLPQLVAASLKVAGHVTFS